MRPVWQQQPAFFRGSYPLLRVFKYSARAEVTHRLILRMIEGAVRDGIEEIETSDRHGGIWNGAILVPSRTTSRQNSP